MKNRKGMRQAANLLQNVRQISSLGAFYRNTAFDRNEKDAKNRIESGANAAEVMILPDIEYRDFSDDRDRGSELQRLEQRLKAVGID